MTARTLEGEALLTIDEVIEFVDEVEIICFMEPDDFEREYPVTEADEPKERVYIVPGAEDEEDDDEDASEEVSLEEVEVEVC